MKNKDQPSIENDIFILCSECFFDEGLKLTSEKYGLVSNNRCRNCAKENGIKISKEILNEICWEYFVKGSYYNSEFGGSSLIMFNQYQTTEVSFSEYLKRDIVLIENTLGVGFFYYGPRLFQLGMIDQLNKIKSGEDEAVDEVLKDIIEKFPTRTLNNSNFFYRLRKNVEKPDHTSQFDSPPLVYSGSGRLDSTNLRILYGSENIEICLHECRITLLDELYLAKLKPNRDLKILDLTADIEEDGTEFESLWLSIRYIFMAEEHSYPICRNIATFVFNSGYDGIIFPSYFSKIKSEQIPNIALFGSPIKDDAVTVVSINRVILDKVDYAFTFGPLING